MKCSVFIAASLDGYISRTDGSIDWLDDANARVPAGEDFGFSQFIAGVDLLVMGRHTFEQVLSFAEWPLKSLPVVVLSRRLRLLPAETPAAVSLSAETPKQIYDRLSSEGANHIYVDGGLTIQGFLEAGLIDEITITTIPVLIGSGRPLFGALPNDVHLELVTSRSFDFGFVQTKYRLRSSQ